MIQIRGRLSGRHHPQAEEGEVMKGPGYSLPHAILFLFVIVGSIYAVLYPFSIH